MGIILSLSLELVSTYHHSYLLTYLGSLTYPPIPLIYIPTFLPLYLHYIFTYLLNYAKVQQCHYDYMLLDVHCCLGYLLDTVMITYGRLIWMPMCRRLCLSMFAV